ncbi:Uncharacterized protein Adt_37161 [Abeliophyllum distichum]|uniref:Putative plant transposon protein domain-containing protein n=1 Tax=Abeliophyllum distichum TaxID=126358 RepID=A0ABD1QJM9_9LAMI
MPRVKVAAKRPRSDRPPSSSSSEEEDPHTKRIDRCLILIGKNVDLTSITFDDPSFNLENLFEGMGWVPILTLDDKVYPTLVKEFYTKMKFSPGAGITCLLRNKRIKITPELIRTILHLEDGGVRLYTTKTIPHTDEYDPITACCHVTDKNFEAAVRLSSNQLTLPCRVLHNIIAHIIVPRKGHLDEHMSCVLSGTRPKALPYGMILTKIFQHFEVSFRDSVALVPKATDTINVLTLKRMKIFKENGQWVAKSKGFDDESGPSTLPFEGEDMDADEDAPPPSPPRPRSHQPSSSTSGINEDQYNLLSGRIDSLTSTVDGMQIAVNDLHNTATSIQATVGGIQATVGGLQSSVDGITSMLHALHSYLGTGFPPPPPPEI